jgi:ATP synthase protein I
VANGSDPDRASGTGDKDFDEVRQRLDALDAKLDAHRPDPVDERAAKQERTNYAMAVRVSSDFIAAIFVGGALGWFLDSVAGTSPFGLIVLLLLGFAAGVLNVMRTLGLVAMPKGMTTGMSKDAPTSASDDASARRRDTEENGREDG